MALMQYTSVINKYKVSNTEFNSLRKFIDQTLMNIKENIKKLNIDAEVVLAGSAAKGTILKNDFDVDIFVRFNIKEKDLSNSLEKALKGFQAKRVHGSRDYFQFSKKFKDKKINFEVIPVLKIKSVSEAKNTTDASPFHVTWVKKKLKSNNLTNEIILSKIFFKAAKTYGAESYINGFSGHVIDILTINYGSFEKLVKAIAKWDNQTIIDTQKHFGSNQKAIQSLNKSKKECPLILIDPIDKTRNAAAAVSEDKYFDMIAYCKSFIENPSPAFFDKKKLDEKEINKRHKAVCKYLQQKFILYMFKGTSLPGNDDVVGTKILKLFESLDKSLAHNDFIVIDADWEWDKKKFIAYIITEKALTKDKKQKGPPIKLEKQVAEFKKKHKKIFIDGTNTYAIVKRTYSSSEKLLKDLLKNQKSVKTITIKKIL